MSRYHIRRRTPGIGVGVVNPRLIRHMLPQIIDPHIHQLRCIQGRASQMGRATGMGRHAVKGKVAPHNGHISLGRHLIPCARMPGQGKVYAVKAPCSGHKLFGAGAFLRRAAEENHTAVQSLLNQAIPNGHSSGKAACAQKIVSTAVARSPWRHSLPLRPGRPLAQTIQGIKLRQQSYHRRSGSVAEHGGKASGDTCHMSFNGKSLPLQGPAKRCGGFRLTVGELRIGPDIPGQSFCRRLPTAHSLPGHFYVCHKSSSL